MFRPLNDEDIFIYLFEKMLHYLKYNCYVNFSLHFPGSMMGRVFVLYLLLMLLATTMSLYGFISGLKAKQVDFMREMNSLLLCLFSVSVLYHVCNYAHYFSRGVSLY